MIANRWQDCDQPRFDFFQGKTMRAMIEGIGNRKINVRMIVRMIGMGRTRLVDGMGMPITVIGM